ncbi:MAG TPA: hypothetical protein PLV45_14570, partial [bacterium]|nr:hypothetical protein [bacterium]
VSGVERLGSIIGSFKSRCVIDNLDYIKENGLDETGKIWQRNYHDQIIRSTFAAHAFQNS